MSYYGNTCESCKGPTFDWWQGGADPQGGLCCDCLTGICAREGCAAIPPEPDETVIDGLCWECASLRWCPEFPAAIRALNASMPYAPLTARTA